MNWRGDDISGSGPVTECRGIHRTRGGARGTLEAARPAPATAATAPTTSAASASTPSSARILDEVVSCARRRIRGGCGVGE